MEFRFVFILAKRWYRRSGRCRVGEFGSRVFWILLVVAVRLVFSVVSASVSGSWVICEGFRELMSFFPGGRGLVISHVGPVLPFVVALPR